MAAGRPEKESRPEKPAQPATGGASAAAAAADKSERSSGKGKPIPPAAGGTSAVAVGKPEQVSRPAKPALPAAGEVSAAAAGAARQASGVSGSRSGYKIPRLISPIQGGYLENFQALPGVLDDCGPGQVLLQCPDGVRVDAVRQSGQGVQRSTLQVPEEAREAAAVIKRTAKPKLQIDQANSKLTVIILICSDFNFDCSFYSISFRNYPLIN